MAEYCIQKPLNDVWVPAYGLTKKSYPKANNDIDAIKIFEEITKNCRTPYRLIKWCGVGYNVNFTIVKSIEKGGL